MRELRFCFDVISSNAYLAWVRMPELARRFDLHVEPEPVLFAALLEAHGQLGPAEVRPKALWMLRNNLRKAAILGVPLRPPVHHPFNPLLALRLCSLDLPHEQRNALVSAVFACVWVRQIDVSDPAAVGRALEEAGFADAAELVARAGEQPVKDRLRARTDAALERGVFGVPTFEVGGELFFGYDDLPYLEAFLAGEDPLDPEAAKLWGAAPPQPGAMRRRFRETLPPSWQRAARAQVKKPST